MKSQCYQHRGWMMRSHTELMWARVFDALGLQYLHEPEIFETRHGWYLPDFYMPHVEAYVEIKGVSATDVEKEKVQDLASATGKHAVIIMGKPNADRHGFASCTIMTFMNGEWIESDIHYFEQLYLKAYDLLTWLKLMEAGKPGDEGEYFSAAEILASSMPSGPYRKIYEKLAAETRNVRNEKAMQDLKPACSEEIGVKNFLDLLSKKIKSIAESDTSKGMKR